MKNQFPDEIYADVPPTQVEAFRQFRATHRNKALNVDGATWHYIACGQGDQVVLLLPGGSRFAETWWQTISALEGEMRIIVPSYPALTTMAAHDRGLAAILDAEDVQQRVDVVGASFGGWLAQTFVRRYPQRVRTVVLSSTSGPAGLSMTVLKLGQLLARVYPQSLSRYGLKRNILKTFAPPPEQAAFWAAYFHETLYLHTTKTDIIAQQEVTEDFLVNYQFQPDDLAGWPGQILIVESEDDLAFKPQAMEALRGLYPQAQVHTFRNVGHTPGYARPEEYLAVLRPFWQGEKTTMISSKPTSATEATAPSPSYFGLQSTWGVTKHLGGLEATDMLATMCHLGQYSTVLEVGCGIGATATHVASRYGCQMVSIDLSRDMLRWASKRVQRTSVESRVTLGQADAQHLPFDSGRFDAVLSESVTAFVDTEQAVAEYARVIKPGGYVGLSEATWIQEPPPDAVDYLQRAMGDVEFLKPQGWRDALEDAGLVDIRFQVHKINPWQQWLDEMRAFEADQYLQAWRSFVTLLFTDPAVRGYALSLWPPPASLLRMFDYFGYGIYVGRKPG